ncbi:MAG: hypothetical protein JNL26_18515, partial [Gemmatimonadetes bacterium]|nr:hypothetical protein [Gemmatimonadota bacterium]
MRAALHFGGRFTRAAGSAVLLATMVACSGVTDSLLEVEDPDLIMPSNARSAPGAAAVANGALGRLRNIAGGSEST